MVPFYNLGVLMALFSPRCTDSLPSVRQHAVDCVHSLLYVQLCYEGNPWGAGGGCSTGSPILVPSSSGAKKLPFPEGLRTPFVPGSAPLRTAEGSVSFAVFQGSAAAKGGGRAICSVCSREAAQAGVARWLCDPVDLFPGFSQDHKDESVEQLKALKPGLKDPDVTVLFQTCCNIARVGGGAAFLEGQPLDCLWAAPAALGPGGRQRRRLMGR